MLFDLEPIGTVILIPHPRQLIRDPLDIIFSPKNPTLGMSQQIPKPRPRDHLPARSAPPNQEFLVQCANTNLNLALLMRRHTIDCPIERLACGARAPNVSEPVHVAAQARVLAPGDEGAAAFAEEAVVAGRAAVVAQLGGGGHAGEGAEGEGVEVQHHGAGLLAACCAKALG